MRQTCLASFEGKAMGSEQALDTAVRLELYRFFGNCIWDALGVVAMLGGTGTVTTWCPDCHEQMSVTVAENRLASGEGVVHFAVPAAHWWDDRCSRASG